MGGIYGQLDGPFIGPPHSQEASTLLSRKATRAPTHLCASLSPGPHLRYRCRAAARRSHAGVPVWPRAPGTRPKKIKNNSNTPTSIPPVAARRCGSHAFIRVATPLLLLLLCCCCCCRCFCPLSAAAPSSCSLDG